MSSRRTQTFLEFIGANLGAARALLEITQDQMASRTGFDVRLLRRIERGQVNLTIESVVRLADALAVPPADLLRPTAVPKPQPGRPPARRRAAVTTDRGLPRKPKRK